MPRCANRSAGSAVDAPVFCSSLSAIANINGTPNCSYDSLFESSFLDNEPYISNLNPDNPNFVTSNGQRYYISRWAKDSRVSSIYGYRLVAVDLNGKSRPNKMVNTGGPLPDIVVFLVLDNGEVYPLSYAADNLQRDGRKVTYINAKVKGYYFSTVDNAGNPIALSSRKNAPEECKAKKKVKYKDENGVEKEEIRYYGCNFSVVPVQTTKASAGEKYFMSYREAYCLSHDAGNSDIVAYTGYCSGSISKSPFCPPALTSEEKAFDKCSVETVRPAFRYNLK